jgi:putative ABC transport system permease protein
MGILEIVSALRRNATGAILIALQVAVTLAIVCNALFFIEQQMHRVMRPTGIDESNVFTLRNQYLDEPQKDDLARLKADLAALRALPGVADVFASYGVPIDGNIDALPLSLTPAQDADRPTTTASRYLVDDHALNTLGLHLLAGRWFNAIDIGVDAPGQTTQTTIITRELAQTLFPSITDDGGANAMAAALGKTVYIEGHAATIIGIIDTLQGHVSSADDGEIGRALLIPLYVIPQQFIFAVRAQPGQRDVAMQAAVRKLAEIDPMRVLDQVQTFSETRAAAYREDSALAIMMGVLSALLLIATALGTIGLASNWVRKRQRQIGVRRALGARRVDILGYFHMENLLVSSGGVVIGMFLAFSLNRALVQNFEIARLPISFMAAGCVLMLLLGQLSVLWPALRAAAISPASATRNI